MPASEELPRERFLKYGENAVSDAELLAILLRTGVEGTPVLQLAERLLEKYDNNLLKLSQASVDDLNNIHGMGMAKSIGMAAAFVLGKRLVKLRLENAPNANAPDIIADYIRANIKNTEQEEFHVLMLDCHLRLLHDKTITIGLLDRSLVHPREVFRDAICESCSHIIVAHTHPTGDVRPSKEDIALTHTLENAGNIIGIQVLDHVVVAAKPKKGKPSYFSFREHKMMFSK